MKNKLTNLVGIITVLILFTGCVSIQIGMYPNCNYPPVDSSTVQIYRAFPPDRETYEVIGEFTVEEGLGDYDSLFYQRLKRRAGEVGGNAVVLARNLERVVGITTAGHSTSTTTTSGSATGTAYGNTVVGSGFALAQTNTTYTPPQTLQIGSYSGRGYVIRFKLKR